MQISCLQMMMKLSPAHSGMQQHTGTHQTGSTSSTHWLTMASSMAIVHVAHHVTTSKARGATTPVWNFRKYKQFQSYNKKNTKTMSSLCGFRRRRPPVPYSEPKDKQHDQSHPTDPEDAWYASAWNASATPSMDNGSGFPVNNACSMAIRAAELGITGPCTGRVA